MDRDDELDAIEIEDVRGLARGMRQLLESAARTLSAEGERSEPATKITGHLRCELSGIVAVAQRFPVWEHVNLQRGVDVYLTAHGTGGDWFSAAGAHGPRHPFEDVVSMLAAADRVGSADYGTAAVGPEENTEVVMGGMVLAATPDGAPVVLGIRNTAEFGPPTCQLDVLAAERATAITARDEVERLIRAHDVFRGQVLSFGFSEHHGNELVTFLPRLPLPAGEVVLPDGVLQRIEEHVGGVGEWSELLLGAGQHLKRGLLLHGPPGTGKTHTVRYLIGRLTDCTVIVLTGASMAHIEAAAALARRLQPSMIVLEDVDLVAADRDFDSGGSPLLFALLNAMDGVGADADVTFILTTNRPDLLEMALADRPGRVDLAVEIPRPDEASRERLLRLYARDLTIDADLGRVAAATEGVTASYVKELIRRTVLAALRTGDLPPVLRGPHFAAALAEMAGEHQALTRTLLGGGESDQDHEKRPRLRVRPGPFPRPGRYGP